jgi:peroxiredoxin
MFQERPEIVVYDPSQIRVVKEPESPKVQKPVQRPWSKVRTAKGTSQWDETSERGASPFELLKLPPAPEGGRQVGLARGSIAPELSGMDLDGQPMDLEQFRGKVVLLFFWGDWCPYCRGVYGPSRQIVERFKDKPFVFLGANYDSSRDRAKQVMEEQRLPWRSWSGVEGGWKVQSLPAAALIDSKGRIRYLHTGGGPQTADLLVKLVDKLLEEPIDSAP